MSGKVAVRSAMTDFWQTHSDKDVTNKSMMLDSNADELTKTEVPEIMSYLPSVAGKDLIELGAGIGRYTRVLAESAKSVVSVDFMEKFVEKNRKDNSHFGNVEFICADVTKLKLPSNSADILFSNWLLMYLDDEEVRGLIGTCIGWLREGGYMFCRESCFRPSGNIPRGQNPTKYRDPALYDALFRSVVVQEAGRSYGLELVLSKSVDTYIKKKNNNAQVVWLLQKVRRQEGDNKGFATFQEFLDSQQYSRNSILRYEKIFGRTFVSTGGLETTEEFVDMLNLKENERVLDVGCGIGGSAFYMEKKFGCYVVAIDLSSNMISLGLERAREVGSKKVQFEVADATKRDYAPEEFDVIYSRDTILHIEDKLSLFKKFYSLLKPGGRLMISDYCCGEKEHTAAFKEYVKQRGYFLISPAQYGKELETAGFVNVRAEDRSEQFIDVLKRELVKFEKMKDEFISEFSVEDYNYIENGWREKIERVTAQDQKWGLFYAEKP
ncbi:uncharacterized protein LOC135475355 [Liolophura sinensis]|uniref:uncharacterized protein LOC135475355 n=1 Tax=Liolophura sinensis TaxID=3198878 RepID=UPI003158A134